MQHRLVELLTGVCGELRRALLPACLITPEEL